MKGQTETAARPRTPSSVRCLRFDSAFRNLPIRYTSQPAAKSISQSFTARRMWQEPARATCFCGVSRSLTSHSRRTRSSEVTSTTTPALIYRARTKSSHRGILRMRHSSRFRIAGSRLASASAPWSPCSTLSRSGPQVGDPLAACHVDRLLLWQQWPFDGRAEIKMMHKDWS
jgi:hypothetical protein